MDPSKVETLLPRPLPEESRKTHEESFGAVEWLPDFPTPTRATAVIAGDLCVAQRKWQKIGRRKRNYMAPWAQDFIKTQSFSIYVKNATAMLCTTSELF